MGIITLCEQKTYIYNSQRETWQIRQAVYILNQHQHPRRYSYVCLYVFPLKFSENIRPKATKLILELNSKHKVNAMFKLNNLLCYPFLTKISYWKMIILTNFLVSVFLIKKALILVYFRNNSQHSIIDRNTYSFIKHTDIILKHLIKTHRTSKCQRRLRNW